MDKRFNRQKKMPELREKVWDKRPDGIALQKTHIPGDSFSPFRLLIPGVADPHCQACLGRGKQLGEKRIRNEFRIPAHVLKKVKISWEVMVSCRTRVSTSQNLVLITPLERIFNFFLRFSV
jgi:hypothetical protein